MKNKKFKIGDKIVCTNTAYLKYNELFSVSFLHLFKTYTIHSYDDYGKINLREIQGFWYDTRRFVSLQEYRKIKLDKIIN